MKLTNMFSGCGHNGKLNRTGSTCTSHEFLPLLVLLIPGGCQLLGYFPQCVTPLLQLSNASREVGLVAGVVLKSTESIASKRSIRFVS